MKNQGNTALSNVHSPAITKSRDTEMVEIPENNSTGYF
jgi:hypothetical protein